MRMDAQEVIRAIYRTLTEQVLPELETASWTASNVRACAMLLVYLEDRVAMERSVLIETNATMRALLAEAVSGRIEAPGNAELHADIRLTLERHINIDASAETPALVEANEAYRKGIERLAQSGATARAQSRGGSDGAFRAALHNCLAQIHERENTILRRAKEVLPM